MISNSERVNASSSGRAPAASAGATLRARQGLRVSVFAKRPCPHLHPGIPSKPLSLTGSDGCDPGVACSDAQLLAAVAQHRDERAFNLFYLRHEGRLRSLAWHLTRNAEQAQDAFQETMIHVWFNAQRFEAKHAASALAWLAKTLSFKALTIWRIQKRHARGVQRQACRHLPGLAGSGGEPQGHADLILSQLRAKLQDLPPEDRQLVGLYFGCGLTQARVAGIACLPQRTISRRLRRVLTSLRAALSSTERQGRPASRFRD